MWDYSEKVKDHFLHPRNVGEIESPDAVGEVGNITCGDALRLTLRIGEGERILDAKFKTFGCGSAIASSSALTEMIKGKVVSEAAKITNKDIADYLGGLPQEKMHCSVMGMEALEAAIANYRGIKIEQPWKDEGKIVCKCFGVTDQKIARVVLENRLTTVEQVTNYCKAGGGCGQCKPEIEEIIKEVWVKERSKAAIMRKKLTNIQKISLIQETFEREIKPALRSDGGDIDLIDVEGNKVYVSLRGTCVECPTSPVTLKTAVEAKLREFVSDDIVVEEVKP
jgi:NifU-like protein